MFRHSIFAAFVTLLSFLSIAGAHAGVGELQFVDADAPVLAGGNLTYADLARRVAPGLTNAPVAATALSGIRHLGGADMADVPDQAVITSIVRLDIVLERKPAMLLLYGYGMARDAAQSVSLLALFDMSGEPRLLDVLDVGMDRETFFMEPLSYVALKNGVGVLFIRNAHHNAGEEFVQTSILALWGDKMHEVDTIGSVSWDAGVARIRTTMSFAQVADADAIEATADIEVHGCEDDCPESERAKLPMTRQIRVRYAWDAAKATFVADSKAFDELPFPNMEE